MNETKQTSIIRKLKPDVGRPIGRSLFSFLTLAVVLNGAAVCWPQAQHRSQAAYPTKLTATQIVERASRALVLITTRNADGQEIARGSGFFIDKGLVATNLHVLRWASGASAKLLANGIEYPVGEVLKLDLRNDVCVLSVEAGDATPLLLGNSGKAAVGDDIIVAGNPKGLEGTFSKGIISGLRHAPDLLQIDAAISPGSSGGPVLNMRGEVIGIASSTLVAGQNLNFAVPINLLPAVASYSGSEVEEIDQSIPGQTFQAKVEDTAASGAMSSISVRTAGSLSVGDRERDGLDGLVHRITVKRAQYNFDRRVNRDVRSEETVQLVTTYSLEGNQTESQSFVEGIPDSKEILEYGSDGLLVKLISINRQGHKEEQDISSDLGIAFRERRVPFSKEDTQGSEADPEHFQRLVFDDRGNVTERAYPLSSKGFRRDVCRFEDRREVECASYLDNVLNYKTRSTYEDDVVGNWIVKHETIFLASFPQFGYAPDADEVRQIEYY